MPAEVMVRGEAEVRTLPDRALINVAIEGEGTTQQDAFRRASESASRIDAVVEKFAAAFDRRITSSVVVRPKTRWKKGESTTTGWIATRTTSLDVKDLTALGRLISELPGAGASSLQGPFWRVDQSNDAYSTARRLAARDAYRRATAYADALGLRLGGVSWIAEPGCGTTGRSPRGAMRLQE
ncbi:MAG: SIMPL domain-containing protein [Candidatus Dormibacteraeota bacterium]|nr:SIMPL domain-containing protein [Candidatus Dormibacteraeota bacterium]